MPYYLNQEDRGGYKTLINPFQSTYEYRLREWKSLRIISRGKPLDQLCVDIDSWWQQVPLVNYHTHPLDTGSWPDPWTMLSENIYCNLTRALGICYTLLMCDVYSIHLYQATNHECVEHNLVVVGSAKYVLNYYPNTVLSTNLNDFKVNKALDLNTLHKHIK